MSFIPITRGKGRRPIHEPRVRIYTNEKQNTISLSLSRPVVAEMKWHRGDSILFSFGVDEDFGRMKLERIHRGARKLLQDGYSSYVASVSVPEYVGDMHRKDLFKAINVKTNCDFVMDCERLFVTIPMLDQSKNKPSLVA